MSLLCGRKEDSGRKLSLGMVAFPQAALLELVKFTELCWVEEKGGGCKRGCHMGMCNAKHVH